MSSTPEPTLIDHADGSMSSSNGAHHRLSPGDPLYLSNSLVLMNLIRSGNREALPASLHRCAAFHEAGHLWAAHDLGLRIEPVRLGSPARPFRTHCEADRLFVSALGPLALSVSVEADTCEFLGLETGYGADFGDTMLPSIRSVHDPLAKQKLTHQQRRSHTYMIHAASWIDRNDLCLRRGDSHSAPWLENLDVLDVLLPDLLSQWWGVDRLARRLMTGQLLTAHDVAELLEDPGHPR